MEHGKERGHGWGKRAESSALTLALRAATISPSRGGRMGTGVMPLPAVGDVLGKLEGSSALTPALSPGEGEGGGALGSRGPKAALVPYPVTVVGRGRRRSSVLGQSRKEAEAK